MSARCVRAFRFIINHARLEANFGTHTPGGTGSRDGSGWIRSSPASTIEQYRIQPPPFMGVDPQRGIIFDHCLLFPS